MGGKKLRKYEMVLILEASLEEDALEAELSKINAIIEKDGGSVLETTKWGVKKLAYPINHKESGNYIILNFTSDDAAIAEIDRVNKINDNVIRHMIVKDTKESKKI
jgi:small subunit ribosomal protein S6